MRRAIQQGRSLGFEPGFLGRYAEVVTELMGAEYGELYEQREVVRKWLDAEEEGFGRTLEQGSRMLEELIARAQESGAEGISSRDAFMLHDTFGFPIEMTIELVAEQGLGVDEEGFEALMNKQRERHLGDQAQRSKVFARIKACMSIKGRIDPDATGMAQHQCVPIRRSPGHGAGSD